MTASTHHNSATSSVRARMSFAELRDLLAWDMRVNRGIGLDKFRAKLLLAEIRLEQYIYRNVDQSHRIELLFWHLCRFIGSVFQWLLCNSNIPGSVTIGRGLRLPHPQNIVIAYQADIGEFCTIYHDVSIIWNGFKKAVPGMPKIGSRVLVGTRALLIGDITIGDDVLIGAGVVVPKSVPSQSRVTSPPANVSARPVSDRVAEAGSERHLRDPYAIWR